VKLSRKTIVPLPLLYWSTLLSLYACGKSSSNDGLFLWSCT